MQSSIHGDSECHRSGNHGANVDANSEVGDCSEYGKHWQQVWHHGDQSGQRIFQQDHHHHSDDPKRQQEAANKTLKNRLLCPEKHRHKPGHFVARIRTTNQLQFRLHNLIQIVHQYRVVQVCHDGDLSRNAPNFGVSNVLPVTSFSVERDKGC